MTFISEYGLFLIKTATLLLLLFFFLGAVLSLRAKEKKEKKTLHLLHLNEQLEETQQQLQEILLSKKELKAWCKTLKKKQKSKEEKKRLFVLRFEGDLRAQAGDSLREEITALLTIAKPKEEVLVILESPGGVVNGYGLCASQLIRLRDKGLSLTIAIDKMAASGGYMMACVAHQILAAPFAIVGSIGVVAQLPNFHRFLKSKHIDYEQLTAGEYKRTLTLFGENTKQGREKVQEEVEETLGLFKLFIHQYRPELSLEKVATGEHWYGQQALELGLVDKLITSDDYLLKQMEEKDVYFLSYKTKPSLMEVLFHKMSLGIQSLLGHTQHLLSKVSQSP